VGAQDRQVALGPAPVLERFDAAGDGTGLACAVDSPATALALEALLQGDIDLEQADRLQRRRLVDDLARWIYDVSVNRDSQRLPTGPWSRHRS
jgi:hypothetical protein